MAIKGFVRASEAAPARPHDDGPQRLDDSQRAVVELPDEASAAILGAPGSGKTTAIIELVAERVLGRGWSPEQIVVLTPSRASATRLRDDLATRLGVASQGPLARTANSLAFGVVRDAAAQAAAEPPRLLTGAEQDQIIADLLEGEIELGTDGYWPDELGRDVRALRGFRTELRDLLMRTVEHNLLPADLARLGAGAERPQWVAAARFFESYFAVKDSFRGRHYDSTELVQVAAALLRESVPPSIARLKLVVVDDAQEATESTMALVRALAALDIAVIVAGDPDISTGAFRGSLPHVIARLGEELGRTDVTTITLSKVYRHSGPVRELVAAVSERIGTAGASQQRRATPVAPQTSTAAGYLVESRADEIALIARRLRERHVIDGVPWHRMAVIVRTGVASLARALQGLEVQTTVSSASLDVRDEFAVRGLVLAVELGMARRPLDAEAAVEILSGPLGGLDSVALRRLKAALRHEELGGGRDRAGDILLAEALGHPAALATIDTRVSRVAQRVAANIHAVGSEATAGATIEELLWGVWQRSGLEKSWFEQSAGSGIVAEEANRHLDAVVALFAAAKRFVERTPDAPPSVFLDAWLGAEVAEDSLAPRSALDSVLVGTPSSAIGREFDIVVIAGLQENVWPNLRVRGSLLGVADLPALAAGESVATTDKRLETMHDELRLFAQATSRARSELIVTAVSNDDSLPSPFLRLVPEGDGEALVRHPLSLRGIVGQARRELASTGSAAAATALAHLAREGIAGADPVTWYGTRELSTDEPLVDLEAEDAHVRVSPSRMETFETCALHWLIDQVGGSSSSTASNLGTIIHSVAETATDQSAEGLFAAVEARWGELSFEAGWQSEVEKLRARDLTARLASYLADFDRAGGTLLAAEGTFELPIGHALLRGSIDRIESYPDGTAVIVDLKTGRYEPTTDDKVVEHPQLGAYQLAFESGAFGELTEGLTSGGAKLVVVSKGSRGSDYAAPRQQPFTPEQLDDFRARVVDDARGMADRVFIAEIGSHCLDPWSFGNCRIHVIQAVSA